jgi:hypothetical protein
MGGVRGVVTLALGFVGIRMLGQGALGLVSSNAIAPWFDRRRGLAIGIVSAVGSAIIALMPLGTTVVIDAVGWRLAWVALGLMVWTVVLPIARFGFVDRPSDRGQIADGWQPSPGGPAGVPVVPFMRALLGRPRHATESGTPAVPGGRLDARGGAAHPDVLGPDERGSCDRDARDRPRVPPDRHAR